MGQITNKSEFYAFLQEFSNDFDRNLIQHFCDHHKKAHLELEASYKIDVSEPSGLAINDSGTELYTVSDKTSRVYQLSLTGDVIKKYDFKGSNLEAFLLIQKINFYWQRKQPKKLLFGYGNRRIFKA